MAVQTLSPLNLPNTRGDQFPGLNGLYSMVDVFLHNIIQAVSVEEAMDSAGIDEVDDLTNINPSDLAANWQQWLPVFIGYVVCAAIGILFFLLLPVTGCCCCCCCCCCKKKQAKLSSFRKKMCCSVTLGLLVAVMASTTSVALVLNTVLQSELSAGGTVSTVNKSVATIDGYLDIVVDDFGTMLVNPLTTSRKKLFADVDSFPAEIATAVDENTQVRPYVFIY